MNIKNRINKLEDQTGIKGGFCQCKGASKILYCQDLTSDAETNEPQLMTDISDTCTLCNREIEKVVLVLKDEH